MTAVDARARWLAPTCVVAGMLGILGSVACAAPIRDPSGGSAPGGLEAPASVRLVVLPDDGLEPLFQLIDGATRTLDAYVFELSSAPIERRLGDAARRGVRVRAIVEPNPSGRLVEARETMARLRKAGVTVKPAGRPFTKTHAKVLLADGASAWVGTANLVDEWVERRDYAVITQQRGTVQTLARIFEQDWLGTSTALQLPLRSSAVDPLSRLVVSPANARAETLAFISEARFSLYLEHDQIDDPAVLDLLARRSRSGVDVRVVTNADEVGQKIARALQTRAPEIQVRLIREPAIHAKVTIADESRVLLGSHNLTKESLDTRREIGIVVDDADAVGNTLGTFRRDFDGTADSVMAQAGGPRTVTPFLWGFAAGLLVPCAAALVWTLGVKRL